MKYDWREATVDDVGKSFANRMFDSDGTFSINYLHGEGELHGGPGAWRSWDGGVEFKFARVYAPVEEDATQEFKFPLPDNQSRWDWYAGLAMHALIATPHAASVEIERIIYTAKVYADAMTGKRVVQDSEAR